MANKAFQDYYPDDMSYCYGCGRLNEFGHQIKSYWDGEESVCEYLPKEFHTAIPGYVYGGLIASIIDCHGTGTAAAASYRAKESVTGSDQYPRFVTASLHVDYLKPTPLGVPLQLRGKIREINSRKVIVSVDLHANGEQCVKGVVIAVRIPESMLAKK
jgi:acyl-coenzyme A thioesterase PaaI-like protein